MIEIRQAISIPLGDLLSANCNHSELNSIDPNLQNGSSDRQSKKLTFTFSFRARRLKRLEGHVITLARSVAQLSSEIRSNHCLVADVEALRLDVNRMQEQLKSNKSCPIYETSTLRRSTGFLNESLNSEKIRAELLGTPQKNRFEKLKR